MSLRLAHVGGGIVRMRGVHVGELRRKRALTLGVLPLEPLDFRAGGVSLLKTSRLICTYCFCAAGTSSSGKIAVTGHSGSHAPQSMHSSGWIYSCSGPS